MWQNELENKPTLFKMMKNLPNSVSDLDELDSMIVREMEQDARISYMALASKLGTSHTTVRRRFHTLVEQGVITVAAIPAYAALGYRAVLILAIDAPSESLNMLARHLDAINSIKYAWVTAGRYNMLAAALYRSPEEYIASLSKEFGGIPENVKIETMLAVESIKSDLPYLTYDVTADSSHLAVTLTELDLCVMKGLEKSPRIPIKELAHDIGVSRSSVRSSLRKLTSRGIIRVVSAPDPAAFGETVKGVTLIQVHPSSLDTLSNRLKAHRSVKLMTLTVGGFNCLVWTSFRTPAQLSDFLVNDLGSIPGVMRYESLLQLKVLKSSFSLMS